MKNKILLPCLALTLLHNSYAQKLHYSIGPELVLPTYHEIKGRGAGISLTAEVPLLNKLYTAVSIGFDKMNTTIIDYVNTTRTDTIHNFSVAPVLVGLKYALRHFYFGGGGGLVLGTYHSGTRWALWPTAGIIIPLKNKAAIDAGAKIIGMPGVYSFDSNTDNFLHKGRYSFTTIRLALTLPMK